MGRIEGSFVVPEARRGLAGSSPPVRRSVMIRSVVESAPLPPRLLAAGVVEALAFIACGMIWNGVRLFHARKLLPLATFIGASVLIVAPQEPLRLLLERRGEVLTSDEISGTIWGYETFGSRNFVEAHVSRLRSKLHEAGADCVISTVRGVGYVVR